MRYNVFSYLLNEGISNVFKNKKSTISSIIIMCATMIIFGIFFAIGQNIDFIMKELQLSQGIQVFIVSEATQENKDALKEQIRNIKEVNSIEFVSKEDGFIKIQKQFGDKAYLLNGYEEILPDSYLVTFTDLSYSKQIQEQIQQFEFVKGITNKEDTTNALMNLGKAIRISTVVILLFLILISISIIANVIKLTVDARKKEISIMKYVGATNDFIRWPFIIEGIIIGIVSGILAILAIGGTYNLISSKIVQTDIFTKINVNILGFGDLFLKLCIVYIILGIGIGILGSMSSMKKYLNV